MSRSMLLALVLASCGHRVSRVEWSANVLAHRVCGPAASIDVSLDRTCTVTVTANRGPKHHIVLDPARCNALFDAAAKRSRARRDCPAGAARTGGSVITRDDGLVYACSTEPPGAELARIGEALAPDWARADETPGRCDFQDDVIEDELPRPAAR